MINKKTKLKIMAQLLLCISIFGMSYGYDLLTNKIIVANAIYGSVDISNIIKYVSIGFQHTIFIKEDGTVWGSGNNSYGQLGISNTTNQLSPVQIPIENVKSVICGENFTIFIKNDGTVWSCGSNYYGQLGIGNTTTQKSPIQIPISDVKDVICGTSSTIFVKTDGTLWGAGDNLNGEFGIGNTNNQLLPIQIPISDVKKIFSGQYRTFFMKNDGTVWATGNGNYGTLGNGNTTRQTSPVQIPIDNVKDIGLGENHTIFIKNDGTAWGCGSNQYGQLGNGAISQQTLAKLTISNVQNVVCSDSNSIFIKNDGTIWGTGATNYGQLGIGITNTQTSPIQIPISDVKNVLVSNFTIFTKNDGTIWGCGLNNRGQLGANNTINQLSPINLTNYWLNTKDLAIQSVTKAESSKLQADVNSAQTLVTALPSGTDKDSLQTRLTAVQNYINNVADAQNKVVNAETTKTQANVDLAQIAINLLPTGDSNRVVLQSRLDVIKNYLTIQIQSLTEAINAVVKAESSKTQADVDSARTLVNALPDGTTKTDLTNRLNAVQTQIDKAKQDVLNTQLLADAQTKVTNAESTKTQINIDTAQTAINLLPTGDSNRVALQSRLDKVKDDLSSQTKITEATNAVVKAENSKTQVDVDYAKTLVNVLPDGADKTDLTNRLNVIQAEIDKTKQDALNAQLLADAQDKVTIAENTKTQADIDLAQTAIDKLPIGTDKTDLQNRLDKIKADLIAQDKLGEATQAVVKAENSKTQVDVDYAKTLVNVLPDGADKTDLTNRLNVVQAQIDKAKQDALNAQLLADAQTKVSTAENNKTQSDIDTAQNAINLLPTGADKTDLQSRLDKVKVDLTNQTKTTEATNAVIKAENTKTQANVDSARTLVNALPDGTVKTDLTNRLNVVQAEIDKAKQDALNVQLLADAQTKVSNAEITKNQTNIDTAQTAINLLPTGTDKTNLQNRLDKVKADLAPTDTKLDDAQKAVTQAEGSKTQADVDKAKTLINTLPDGAEKTDLTNKLKAIQDAIDKAKQDAINSQLLADAKAKVETAEKSKTLNDINIAQSAINKLSRGTDKTSLQKRLDAILIENAKSLMTTAEGAKNTYDILKTQNAISLLPDGAEKEALQARLDNVKEEKAKEDQIIADTKEATLKVQIAEASVNLSSVKTYIANAQIAIDKLPSSTEKTALQDRLNKVTTQISANANKSLAMQADPLVKFAELYKTTTYKNKAWAVVNQMTDCESKTKYVNRLNVIK